MARTPNIFFKDLPVVFHLASPQIVILDPLFLDGVASSLPTQKKLSSVGARAALKPFNGVGNWVLRLGVFDVPSFRPGLYELGPKDLRVATSEDRDVMDVDSGSLVIVDASRLIDVAAKLTWDVYEQSLGCAGPRNAVIEDINDELGGPCFSILSSCENSDFDGDGSYTLKARKPRRKR